MIVRAQASPNIALIKYWGKQPSQSDESRNLATNPSLSLTLSRSHTVVRARFAHSTQHLVQINQQIASPKDIAKVTAHIERIAKHFQVSLKGGLHIQSDNNFPQGTGIASSASAYAALTCAIAGLLLGVAEAKKILATQPQVLSALARRGSGSASRSVFGPYSYWDGGPCAEPFDCQWPLFDSIVMFTRAHKKVPSSEGHEQATQSPFFADRLQALPARVEALKLALKTRDFGSLKMLIEAEALELHKIAASGPEPIDYLTAQSRQFVEFLQKTKPPELAFTLDAGPNVHLISAQPQTELIESLMSECFGSPSPQVEVWADKCGLGPTVLEDLTNLE